MKVVWQEAAKVGRRQVAAYIRKEFGTRRAKTFRQEIDDTVRLLMNSPGIGQIDPLYADRPLTYRSIVINGLKRWSTASRATSSTSSTSGTPAENQQTRPHRQNSSTAAITSENRD